MPVGCMVGACIPRGHAWWGGHVWPGGVHAREACMLEVGMAGETATAVGDTHPTRMHSCYN